MGDYFSFALLGYKLKSRARTFVIWSVISLCLFIMIIVMFSNLLSAGVPDIINDMMASMPGAVTGSASESQALNFKDFGVNFGVCMQIMLIVGCIFASYLGASAVVGNRGDNDINFVFSMPVSRVGAVLTSYTAQAVVLFCYNIVVMLVSLAVLYSNNKMNYLVKVFLAVAAFLLIEIIYLSISFMLSTFMNSGSQASSISAVVVTITVMFGLLGSLSKSLGIMKILSPYMYVSVFAIIAGESRLYLIGISAGILMAIVSLVVSCVRYDKIDLILD